MPNIELIWVTSGRHPETEALICKATNSRFAHSALAVDIDGCRHIVEAVRPAVRFSDQNLFDNATELQIISVDISNEQQKAVADLAINLAGKPYGVDDCIIGGAHDVLGDGVARLLDRFINNDNSFNCSGLQTLLVRAAFPDYMAGENVSMITPEAARVYAVGYFKPPAS